MRILKLTTFLLFSVCLSFNVNAQKDKGGKKVAEQIEEINTILVTADKALALSQEQKDKISVLYKKRNEDIKALDAQGLSEEDKTAKTKEIRKNANMELNNNILTKEQKKARNAAKKE